MSDDLRQRYAEALIERIKKSVIPSNGWMLPGMGQIFGATEYDLADAVLAVRDEKIEQIRYERRLLGAARMVLDLVAAGDSSRWEGARRAAEDVAQRIVDEIGHSVTDEPALGPGYRLEIAARDEALTRIRRLHFAYRGPSDTDSCAHCNRISGGLEIPWPCPTIAALDGNEEAERG